MKVKYLNKILKILQEISTKLDRQPIAPSSDIQAVPVQKPEPEIIEKIIEKIVEVEKEVVIETIPKYLEPFQELLSLVLADADVAQLLLGNHQHDTELARLIASATQMERIEKIWDIFAERCRARHTGWTASEQSILTHCVEIHNLIWQDKAAKLIEHQEDINQTYDYAKHQKGTLKGNTVVAIWLPELQNAGGKTIKKMLVEAV